MANERKDVIVNEIHYWKQHKLLPTEYCDFLLALYTEGEEEESNAGSNKKAFPIRSLGSSLYVILLLSLLPVSFLVIHFTELSILMQTGIITFILLFVFLNIWFFSKKNSIYIHIAIIVFLLILFLHTVHLFNTLMSGMWPVYITIIVNCVLWIAIGFKKRLIYLISSGFIGLVVLGIYIFF